MTPPALPEKDRPRVSYRVRHLTRYTYSQPVTLSHHAAHLRPRTLMRQACHTSTITVHPAPATLTERQDFFGNTATFFTLENSHSQLDVLSDSLITVSPPALPDAAATPPWEDVAKTLGCASGPDAMTANLFIHPSPLVPVPAAARILAMQCFPAGRPVLDGALELTRRIHTDFAYDPSATDIATPLSDVMDARRGVCQDFAHVQIAALRSLGLAARYTSGYVLTNTGLTGGDASHAWVSVWIPDYGWIDLDPTNNKPALDEHVIVAWGRDFDDVSPLKGVMVGGGAHQIDVSVDVTPATTPVIIPGIV